ncbi:MAG: N-acetylmuramoyl-L-alanine amidase-like domain-containing protein [Gammaproteobacteria bacterium]
MPNRHIITALIWCLTLTATANPAPIIPTKDEIHALVQSAQKYASQGDKIAYLSRLFIDGPKAARMEWGPLGEGAYCDYNCKPLYRFDAFDCTTFVEMMLALATTDATGDADYTLKSFKHQVLDIRYSNPKKISYLTRNHFPEVDWIPHNTRQGGLLTDMTGGLGIDPVETPAAVINKKNWYAHKKLSDICIWDDRCDAPIKDQKAKLAELQKAGQLIPNENVMMLYIPVKDVLRSKVNIVANIPNGSIIQFIRPNWNASSTHMHVAHQGIVVQDAAGTWLHHASSAAGEMHREKLMEYLEHFRHCGLITKPEMCVEGINILRLVIT